MGPETKIFENPFGPMIRITKKDKKVSKKGLLFGAFISNSKGFRIEGGETERETKCVILKKNWE